MSNSNNGGYHVSPTATLNSTTAQKRQYPHQEQPTTQYPYISGKEPPHHTAPPPATIPNTPAPWQLGRHSHYTSSTEYDQKPLHPNLPPILGSAEGDGGGKRDTAPVPHLMSRIDEEGLRDVEEELHRGLKARQVRLLSGSEGVQVA